MLRNCKFFFGEGCHRVLIGDNCRIEGVEFILRNGGKNVIVIGDGSTTGGHIQMEASEGTKIILGKDCMMSHHIKIYTTDSHSILNMEGHRINPSEDIYIGNHVWIGMDVMILKGSLIGDGSIIGAKSLYSKRESQVNTIYGGVPAKEIKSGIHWDRRLL